MSRVLREQRVFRVPPPLEVEPAQPRACSALPAAEVLSLVRRHDSVAQMLLCEALVTCTCHRQRPGSLRLFALKSLPGIQLGTASENRACAPRIRKGASESPVRCRHGLLPAVTAQRDCVRAGRVAACGRASYSSRLCAQRRQQGFRAPAAVLFFARIIVSVVTVSFCAERCCSFQLCKERDAHGAPRVAIHFSPAASAGSG